MSQSRLHDRVFDPEANAVIIDSFSIGVLALFLVLLIEKSHCLVP